MPAFVHAPFLGVPRGQVSEKLFYVSDWYVTLATLAGVPPAVIFNSSGPVPPDGMDVWSAIINETDSPRDIIVHEYDDVQHVYAIRFVHSYQYVCVVHAGSVCV